MKKLATILTLGFAFIFSACSNDNSSDSSQALVSYTEPSGKTVLPSQTTVSTTAKTLFIDQGKGVSTAIIAEGSDQEEHLSLQADVYKVTTDGLVATNEISTNFKVSSISTKGEIKKTTVLIDAANAASGDYLLQVKASSAYSGGNNILATIPVSVKDGNPLKASYLQLDAIGSLSSITSSGYATSNIMIFAFADISSKSSNASYLSAMQTAINNASSGTINFLSIGGQTATTGTINAQSVTSILSNVDAQIKAYNSALSNGKISGVDLDLENGIDADTIYALAKGFHDLGYAVSVAPQVYVAQGSSAINSSSPTNLVLTSGAVGSDYNQYGKAISSGYVDYILAQTYNTGGFTIDGYSENSPTFFQKAALALNNVVSKDCTSSVALCIPEHANILIGQVSNAGASGTVNNVFGSNGTSSYDQSAILNTLLSYVNTALASEAGYSYIDGIMQWSLNNDYMPSGWGDSYATSGAFSTILFGASPAPSIPYFTIQVSNTLGAASGSHPYASATLVVNDAYYVFGTTANTPIAPANSVTYGTKTSANANPNVVAYSSNLDTFFSGGATSFNAKVLLNTYTSQSNLYSPTTQLVCANNQKFESGKSYNVMINPDAGVCQITSW